MLSVGDEAPEVEGVDQNGKTVRLSELVGTKNVVLYFYPRDFTPVCTRQACLLRDVHEELEGSNAAVIGVSVDESETHAKFSERYGLPFSLLADPDKTIAQAYDVRRLLSRNAKRVTYVIDRSRRIRGVFHYELSARKHVDGIRRLLGELGDS